MTLYSSKQGGGNNLQEDKPIWTSFKYARTNKLQGMMWLLASPVLAATTNIPQLGVGKHADSVCTTRTFIV